MSFSALQRRLRWLVLAQNEALWPLITRLPLVRRSPTHRPELGFLLTGRGPVVYLGDLDDPRTSAMKVERHASFEEMFASGWEVD